MPTLITQQDSLEYAGFFSSPAFALLKGGIEVIEGVYKAFADFDISLGDISFDSMSSDFAPQAFFVQQALRVDLGELGDYKFGVEKVEWTGGNTDDDLERAPELLLRGERWLRSVAPELTFELHALSRYSHNTLSEGTSREFFRGLSALDIPSIGESLGSGIIFHWELPENGWRMNLTLDHSNLFADGIFIEQELFAPSNDVDYARMLAASREILNAVLARLGLEFAGGVD